MKISPLIEKFVQARFFSISLLVHVIIVVLLSGVALVREMSDDSSFIATYAPEGIFSTDDAAPGEPAPEPVEFEEMTYSETQETAVSAPPSLLTALATDSSANSSFSVNTASVIPSVGSSLTGSANGSSALSIVSSAPSGRGGGGGGLGRRTLFGQVGGSTATGLEGTFFDLKQDRDGKTTDMTVKKYGEVVTAFVEGGFKHSVLKDFYQGSEKLYANEIFIPDIDANLGPAAFGLEKEVQPRMWLVLYRGQVSPPSSGTYHFVGAGDDVMVIRLNGKVVLDRSWYLRGFGDTVENYNYGFSRITEGFAKGPAMKLQAGTFYEVEILMGEQPGGRCFATVLIEKQGVSYKKHTSGAPILPVFRVGPDNLPPLKLEDNASYPPHAEKSDHWKVR